eukprot:408742_1
MFMSSENAKDEHVQHLIRKSNLFNAETRDQITNDLQNSSIHELESLFDTNALNIERILSSMVYTKRVLFYVITLSSLLHFGFALFCLSFPTAYLALHMFYICAATQSIFIPMEKSALKKAFLGFRYFYVHCMDRNEIIEQAK